MGIVNGNFRQLSNHTYHELERVYELYVKSHKDCDRYFINIYRSASELYTDLSKGIFYNHDNLFYINDLVYHNNDDFYSVLSFVLIALEELDSSAFEFVTIKNDILNYLKGEPGSFYYFYKKNAIMDEEKLLFGEDMFEVPSSHTPSTNLQGEDAELLGHLKVVQEAIEGFSKKIQLKDSEINKWQQRNKNLQEVYNDVQKKNAELQESYNAVQNKNAELQESYNAVQNKNNELIEGHNDIQKKKDKLQKDNVRMQERIIDLQSSNVKYQNSIADLKKQIASLEKQVKDIDNLKAENNILTKDYADMRSLCNSLNSELEKAKEKIEHGNYDVFEQSRVIDNKDELDEAKETIESLRKQLRCKEEQQRRGMVDSIINFEAIVSYVNDPSCTPEERKSLKEMLTKITFGRALPEEVTRIIKDFTSPTKMARHQTYINQLNMGNGFQGTDDKLLP